MAELLLDLYDDDGRAFNAIVAAEFIDVAAQHVVRTVPVTVGSPTSVELDPGRYYVRVDLPSGRTLSADVAVSALNPTPLRLAVTHSAHEWLAWSQFVGEVAAKPEYDREAGEHATGRPVALWHRLWEQSGQSWSAQPWPDAWVDSDGYAWSYRFSSSRRSLRVVQVGGMGVAARCVVLPPADHVDVLIRPVASDAAFHRGAQLAVSSNDRATEGLLRFLTAGSIEPARAVGDELVARSEDMLRSKVENPLGAAVAGYFLLQQRAWSRLHDWPTNFVRYIDWLPDAAIIQGSQFLHQPDQRDPGLAAAALIEATRRGIPVFTAGLRRLCEGLRLLAGHLAADDAQRPGVEAAYSLVSRYGDAADWTHPYTTFYGADPGSPSIASFEGVPLDLSGVHFLAEGTRWPIGGSFPTTPGESGGIRARRVVRVVPVAGGWVVEDSALSPSGGVAGAPGPAPFARKREAVTAARAAVASGWPAWLVVYRRDGSTERADARS